MINNLGEGSIPKLMAKLAIPAVVAQVVNLLYNIVDRIYIGHIPQIGADALTGVGLFTPVLMLLNALPVRVEHQGLLFIWVRKIMLRQRKLSGTVLHF
jgi:Na+-driven multidrug efflux pump